MTPRYTRVYLDGARDVERAYQLLPAYIASPDLALSVKEFVLGQNCCGVSESSPRVSDAEHASIESHVRGLGLDAQGTRAMLESLGWRRRRKGLGHGLRGGCAEDEEAYQRRGDFAATVKVIMLSLCRNVETLYFFWALSSGPLRDYVLASNYGLIPRPALQRLRHLVYRGREHNYDGCYDALDFVEILRYVHRLPQITSLTMDGVALDPEVDSEVPFPPKTSHSLKRICLRHVHLDPYMVATIVRIPVALEELSLSLGGLMPEDKGLGPNLNPALLERALRQHKATLRVLDLDVGFGCTVCRDEPYPHVDDGDDELYGFDPEDKCYKMDLAASGDAGPLLVRELDDSTSFTIGSLRDYAALTRLSINVEVLVAGRDTAHPYRSMRPPVQDEPVIRLIDMLPPNLEYLCLYNYKKGENDRWDSHVAELMEHKAERLPKLKEVVGVGETEPGVGPRKLEERGWPTDETQWQRPDDGLDGEWVEE